MTPRLMQLAVLAALPLWPTASTWAAKPDPIEAALTACLARPGNDSTTGTVDCTGAAIQAWDKRLNATYQHVMAGLDPKSQELLRASQRRWVAFRESEQAALEGPWREGRGTIVRILTVNADLTAIKERVEELLVYDPDED